MSSGRHALNEIGKLLLKSTLVGLLAGFVFQSLAQYSTMESLLPGPERCRQSTVDPAFGSFDHFYPFYLCEHSLRLTRLFHFVATFNAAFLFLHCLLRLPHIQLVMVAVIQAYALAWFSHFFIEQNRPATFRYPVYSFLADWNMFFDTITLRL